MKLNISQHVQLLYFFSYCAIIRACS